MARNLLPSQIASNSRLYVDDSTSLLQLRTHLVRCQSGKKLSNSRLGPLIMAGGSCRWLGKHRLQLHHAGKHPASQQCRCKGCVAAVGIRVGAGCERHVPVVPSEEHLEDTLTFP